MPLLLMQGRIKVMSGGGGPMCKPGCEKWVGGRSPSFAGSATVLKLCSFLTQVYNLTKSEIT